MTAIRQLRIDRDLTQLQCATLGGWADVQSWQQLEREGGNPTVDTLRRAALVLGMHYLELVAYCENFVPDTKCPTSEVEI